MLFIQAVRINHERAVWADPHLLVADRQPPGRWNEPLVRNGYSRPMYVETHGHRRALMPEIAGDLPEPRGHDGTAQLLLANGPLMMRGF